MSRTKPLLNLKALEQTPVIEHPFPYLIVKNFLQLENCADVLRDYPHINYPGSVPLNQIKYGPGFQRLIDELEGLMLRNAIAKKFNMDLDNRPTMITLRGKTRSKRDGKIHTDSKSKLITVLLYMNPHWNSEQGKLRLLHNSHDINDYVAEISPELGTCLFFKVTDNCWHGHKPFKGTRRSIQLNYVNDTTAASKHIRHHQLTAFLKNIKNWFRGEKEMM